MLVICRNLDVKPLCCSGIATRLACFRVAVLLVMLRSPAVLRVSVGRRRGGGLDSSCVERSVGDSLSVATAPGSV